MPNDTEPAPIGEPFAPPQPSKSGQIGRWAGRVFLVVTQSPKLRALLAGGIAAGFAFIGMQVDGDTALAMIGAAGLLAGWGPKADGGSADGQG